MSISPGPEPFFPHVLMNLPSLLNFTMRALVLPPCPSATKMSPFGATRTADGALNSSGPLPATPALPSVINTRPSGLNLIPWWPFPSLPSPSVTQTLPSLSTCRPCGNSSSPAPNAFNSLPDESNLRIGGKFDPSQAKRDPRFHERGRSERAAPLRHPDTGAIGVDIHAAGRTPRASFRQFPPVLDRMIRVGRGIGRSTDLGAGPYCCDTRRGNDGKRECTARSDAIRHRSPPLAEPGFGPAFVV